MSDLPPPPPPPGSTFPNAGEPGDVPGGNWEIRPPETLDAVSVVGQGLRLWRRIAVPGFLIVFLLQGVWNIVAIALDGHICDGFQQGFSFSLQTGELSPGQRCQPGPMTSFVGFALLFVIPLVFVALLRMATGSAVEKREQGFGVGLGHASRRYGSALVAGLAALLLLLGLLVPLFIVVILLAEGGAAAVAILIAIGWAVVVFVAFSLTFEAFLLEDVRGFRPIGRSWALVRRRFFGALGSLFLYGLIAFGVAIVIVVVPQATMSDRGFGAVVQAAAMAVANAVTTPMLAGVLTTMYLRLKSLEEGRPVSPGWVKGTLSRYDSA